MRSSILAAMLLAAAANFSAFSEFYTYSRWEALPTAQRAAYIAGAFDSLVGYGETDADQKTNVHYNNCIRRAQINNGQLAENVLAYARARPEHQISVQGLS